MFRLLSYILFVITGVFCIFVIVSFFRGSMDAVTDTPEGLTSSNETPLQTLTLFSADDQGKIDDRIEDLEAEVEKLSREIANRPNTVVSSGWSTANLTIPAEIRKRLAKGYTIKSAAAGDIFWFYSFGAMPMSTYSTGSSRIYVFGDPYYVVRRNMTLLARYYDFNDNNVFFEKSFFLNSKNADGINRFVFDYKWTAVGVEVVASEYEETKDLLLDL